MSWGAAYTVDNDNIVNIRLSNVTEVPEHEEQYNKAAELAYELITSGAVGDPKGRYGVNLSGHGNPNHEPKSGWANDFISIQVAQHIREEE
jgi:hypothetical protein